MAVNIRLEAETEDEIGPLLFVREGVMAVPSHFVYEIATLS
jgi:hypothetical protein